MWSLKANITAYGNPAPAVTVKVEKVADKNGDVSSNDRSRRRTMTTLPSINNVPSEDENLMPPKKVQRKVLSEQNKKKNHYILSFAI